MELNRFEYSRVQMGGQARIVLFAPTEVGARDATRAAFDEIERLENIFSDWRPRSELSRLSASSGGPSVRVSRDLFRVLERAQKISRLSGGAFDVTVGPLTRLWRASRTSGRLPERVVLREAMARVGWEKLELNKNKRTVQLTVSGMILDAGGIAKGYALDRALAVLRSRGVRSCLLQMGGDLRMGDPPPGERGWTVEVGQGVRCITCMALSTSGTGEQWVQIGRRRYAHIVDPRTGLGLTRPALVHILASEGLVSDPLATALCILDREEHTRQLTCAFPGSSAVF